MDPTLWIETHISFNLRLVKFTLVLRIFHPNTDIHLIKPCELQGSLKVASLEKASTDMQVH